MRNLAITVCGICTLSGCFYFDIDVGNGDADAAPGGVVPDADLSDAHPSSCDDPLPCPAPANDRAMLCGRVLDTETTQSALPGAKPYRIGFHDALAWANDPGTLPQFYATPDSCGRFVSADATHPGVQVPSTSFIVIAVDDLDPGVDTYVPTAIGVAGVKGAKAPDLHAYATHHATDAKWSAGLAGPSFAEQGVYLAIFIETASGTLTPPFPGTPQAGVTVTADGTTAPASDFYFSNGGPLTRTTVAPAATVTGANGSALLVNANLVPYSGVGGLGAGCSWPETLAKASPGTVFVQERVMTCP